MPKQESETCRFRVGYALPPRKNEAFMVEPFITQAKQHAIDFIPIDPSKPLTEQGPFNCIIHKLYDPEWNLNLQNFSLQNHTNNNLVIIDPPTAIQRLHNRITMLESVAQLNISNLKIPNQLLVQDSESLNNLNDVNGLNGLNFPVIAKALLANGGSKAHKMSLVFNKEGLAGLDTPVVLQQFVNHGGVIFKVYVADEYVKCVTRSSLPDVSNEMVEKMTLSEPGGVMSFSQISSTVMNSEGGLSGNTCDEKVKMPDPEFVDEVGRGLREALGLHLFNFDMIKDDKTDGYLVVDINYFPGFEKLPGYESIMTDFFLNLKKLQEDKKKKMVE